MILITLLHELVGSYASQFKSQLPSILLCIQALWFHFILLTIVILYLTKMTFRNTTKVPHTS